MKCKSILIIEDNEDIRETVEDALRAEGYNVESAPDGLRGLERLKEMKGPTLVLLDLMMPVMSGWEFLDKQKEDGSFSSHRVVTISSVPATESLNDPTPLQTDGTIQKPLTLDKIMAQVREHCELPEESEITI